jgi:hypothetical protein
VFRKSLPAVVAAICCAAALAQQAGQSIDPPAGQQVVLKAKGIGAQIYTCTAAGSAYKWTLKGPDARLMDANGTQIGTHFAGPAWKLNDGSQVQGELAASRPAPDPDNVPWLLLRVKAGSATATLARVDFIQRTETQGGVAPATGCDNAVDSGKTARVDYSATYTFYSAMAR